jgi:hypothetical protein
MRKDRSSTYLIAVAATAIGIAGYVIVHDVIAEELPWNKGLPRQHKSKWLVSDGLRPQPTVVTPGQKPGDPPSDAVVLFDGKDLSKWRCGDGPARWKVEGGVAEMTPTGSISTVETFGDMQFHLEWMAPSPPVGSDQGRGNSGIFFMERYEVQILDSYENKTYADGSAASIYAQHPPLVNACRKPGEWQTYDIIFRAPRFKDGKVLESARVTMFHNGVLVHHNAEVFGSTVYRGLAQYQPHPASVSLQFQDHGDKQPVRFRNIWARHLDLTAEPQE